MTSIPTLPDVTDETRDALRLAAGRTWTQVKESGAFLYKKKKPGKDIELEFFDILVFLLSNKDKGGDPVSIISARNFKIEPEDRQLSFDDISNLKKKAYQFIQFSKALEAEDSPIPDDYRHLARMTEKETVALEFQAIGDHLLKMFNVISFVGGGDEDGIDGDVNGTPDLYVYDDKTGIYSKDASALKNEITRISEIVQYKGSVVNATREILFYVAYADPQKVYPFNKGENCIPVLNGIIELDFDQGNHTLHPHSPEKLFTYFLPVRYDPKADPEPIDKILCQYVNKDDLWYLYQIAAQALLQGFCECGTLRTAYLIQGPARGGKSTFCDLLVGSFFSSKFVANETLQDLCGGNRFSTYSLPGKFMNLYDDLDDMGTLQSVSKFKNLIGSYNQSVEKKGVQRRTEKISCVHVFTCNRPPLMENTRIKTDKAWWDRWVYLKFVDSDFKLDPTFQERNFTPVNLSGFLNRVLELVVTIKADRTKFRIQNYEIVLSNWDAASDTITSFVADCFYPTPGRPVKYNKEKTLAAYLKYCNSIGIEDIHGISTVEKLSRRLIDAGFTTTGRGKNREYLYVADMGWQGKSEIPDPTHREDMSQGRL